MAFYSLSLSEDQFQCSICLDVFIDPVTTSCGHNFCKTCITGYWESSDHCQCPKCKNAFERRPDLKVNTLLSEMVKNLASVNDETKPLEESPLAESGDIPCDLCTEKGVKALKSCLVCLASYCETHLEPHQIMASFKKHKLIDLMENLEDRMCKKHGRPLELFCKYDKICVCQFCIEMDHHKTHTTVSIEDECEERKVKLGRTEAQVQQMIQQRQQTVQEIRDFVKVSERNTEKEITDTVQVFTSVIRSIEKKQAEIIDEAEKKQKAVEKKADKSIKLLGQEINRLQTRSSELRMLKRISHTVDQLHLLKTSLSLCILPATRNLSTIKAPGDLCPETVNRALSHVEKTLTKEQQKYKLQGLNQYVVDVTLDPDTAHPYLIVSDDRRQVRCGDVMQNLPSSSQRFDHYFCVLAKEGFNSYSGRSYYEVEVAGNTSYCIGVVKETINRNSGFPRDPRNGVWVLELSWGLFKACVGDPPFTNTCTLSLKEKPRIVGVFVDCENGEVSFYNAETGSHIYSFTQCTFIEKLYPCFWNLDSCPLILHPVIKTN